MKTCSWFKGGHDFVIIAMGTSEETWYETCNGFKIDGSEYIRYRPTVIKRCAKCNELIACDGWAATPVSVNFAKQKIIALGGIVEEGL